MVVPDTVNGQLRASPGSVLQIAVFSSVVPEIE
jgi:hypothetical protein